MQNTSPGYPLWNCSELNATEPHTWEVNIDSGNDLVFDGTNPLSQEIWLRSLTPYGVSRPQLRINTYWFRANGIDTPHDNDIRNDKNMYSNVL